MDNSNFIEWKDRYSVGNKFLDTDHKEIISIINDLYSSLQDLSGANVIGPILDRLLDYTMSHFEREEDFMEIVNYPDLTSHKAAHEILAEKTRELIKRNNEGRGNIPIETLEFLKGWWVNHITFQDMLYKPYMKKEQAPRPKSEVIAEGK